MILKGTPVDWQTRLRLWAGLTMALYVVGYTVYYCLGLFSLAVMEAFRNAIALVWPIYWIFPLAVLTHVALGMWKLFKRNTLKLPLWEVAQISLGMTIPFFLLPHLISTHGMFLFFRTRENSLYDLLSTYPRLAWQSAGMILVIWAHAQIGVHAVLRMRPWYPRARAMVALFFSAMPIFGIVGYARAGNEAIARTARQNPERMGLPLLLPSAPQQEILNMARDAVYITFPILYAVVLVGRDTRLRIQNRKKNIAVHYSDGSTVRVFAGTTLLEASRIGNIPHASICGGRGRCTTCRVKVETGIENLSPAGEREKKVMSRIGAAPDVRLACQAECERGEVGITLLLPADIQSVRARKENRLSVGTEMDLVVMFADLRGFTSMSEGKLPYDVVFILNKYFSYMGEAIEKNHGIIDKFMGDGILSYFGFQSELEAATKNALRAARQMALQLQDINDQLKHDLKEPLRLGMSIHCGEVILGDVGYKERASLTIIGDTVNTGSRLEHLNKHFGSQLIISSPVADLSRMDVSRGEKHRIAIRGKVEPLHVLVFKNVIEDIIV